MMIIIYEGNVCATEIVNKRMELLTSFRIEYVVNRFVMTGILAYIYIQYIVNVKGRLLILVKHDH